MITRDITIPVAGDRLHGVFFPASGDLSVDGKSPCAVMAHGLAGTVDSGLAPFAEAIAAAGIHVLAFDYRGFGLSSGLPRQTVVIDRQLEDYRAALTAAGSQPEVDASRLVLWGVSLAGGHVLQLAPEFPDLAAVVSLIPLVSGPAAGLLAARHHPASQLAASAVRGAGSRVGERLGRAPVMIPVVGQPGSRAAFSIEGAEEAYLAMAGPTWRNEVNASITVEMGSYRVGSGVKGRAIKDNRVPTLVQIADLDQSAPPQASAKVAFKARAQVRHYPCDHFDVFKGEWHEAAVAHQVAFLKHQLAPLSAGGEG